MKFIITSIFILTSYLGFSQNIFFDYGEHLENFVIKRDTLFNSNGTIKQIGICSYNINGEKHGKWLIFDGNNTLRAQMFYDKGIRKGKWEIYDNHGNLITERNYNKSN